MRLRVRPYIVTVRRREDLDSLYQDMESPGGNRFIPNRVVELIHRWPISRNTSYLLTDEEAQTLKNDPRVLDVDLTDEEKGVIKVNSWTQTSTFNPNPGKKQNTDKNWGLYFSTIGTAVTEFETKNSTGFYDTKTATISRKLSGKNVDLIVDDAELKTNHAEFAVNVSGTGGYRFVSYNWGQLDPIVTGGPVSNHTYPAPLGDHATMCAAIAAGNTQGWAKDVNIYQKGADSYKYALAFHLNKPINVNTGYKNPTIITSSTNSFLKKTITQLNTGGPNGTPSVITFRGKNYVGPWNWDTIRNSFSNGTVNLIDLGFYGVFYDGTDNYVWVSDNNTAENADIEDCINAGIVVVKSAANNYRKLDAPGGIDYNNRVVINGETFYINRSEYNSDGPILVGNLQQTRYPYPSSAKGSAIDVYAPGTDIITATAATNASDVFWLPDPRGMNSDQITSVTGTSFSCPQVAGVLASLAEINLELNNGVARSYIRNNAKKLALSRTVGTALFFQNESLFDGSTNTLFFPDPVFTFGADAVKVSNGQVINYGVRVTNVPDGAVLFFTESGTATGSDFIDNGNNLKAVVRGGIASLSRIVSPTLTGSKTSTLQLRTGGYTGTIQATYTVELVSSTVNATYAITVSKTSATNNDTIKYTINTTSIPNGAILNLTEIGTSVAGDFIDNKTTLNFTINNNIGEVYRTVAKTFFGTKVSTIQLRTYNGVVKATAPSVTLVGKLVINSPATNTSIPAVKSESDKITNNPLVINRKVRRFIDLDLGFSRNDFTSDINKKFDVEAVKNSVKNLVLTRNFERPFHPEIGCQAHSLLFENFTPIVKIAMEKTIVDLIEKFEPRAKIIDVNVDDRPDENGIIISVTFLVGNIDTPITINTLLNRVR